MLRYTVLVYLFSIAVLVYGDYWSDRNEFIKNEDSKAVGAQITLSDKEEQVNKILMKLKTKELNYGFLHPEQFPPALHFFKAKETIDNSTVFSFIKNMPKGGALHVHDTVLTSLDFVIYNITYREYLYACIEDEKITSFKFAKDTPSESACWQSVQLLRSENRFVEDFDSWLRSQLSLIVDEPQIEYSDSNTFWQRFSNLLNITVSLLSYRPVWEDYFYQGLVELFHDNVRYVEIRGTLPELYDLEGRNYNQIEVLGILNEKADEFLKNQPDFFGIKYIYAAPRFVSEDDVEQYLKNYNKMKELYPEFLVGFDLIDHEDKGYPLTKFIGQLTGDLAKNVQFYFHAGENNWNGMPSDMNLIDAILLNTTRIGHGFAITKHQFVLEQVKERGIGLEINPISNQVTTLVQDLRNHPAASLLADNYPVVISSDGGSLWDAKGLSYDYYETFIGLSNARSDLKLLKQLTINSILYSSLEESEKRENLLKLNEQWNVFIDDEFLKLKFID